MAEITERQIATERIHAFAHKLRLQILQYISDHPDCQVRDIYTALKIEQSVCSQHLKLLRDAELVFSNRVGKQVFYTPNTSTIEHVEVIVDDFLKLKK